MAIVLYDGAQQPIVRSSRDVGSGKWWIWAKRIVLWLSAGGLLTFLLATDKFITSATSIYHWAGGSQPENPPFESPMSGVEADKLISLGANGGKTNAADMPSDAAVLPMPLPGAVTTPAPATPPPVAKQSALPVPIPKETTPPKVAAPVVPPVQVPAKQVTQPKETPRAGPLEITSIVFNSRERVVDVTVRNPTKQSAVITEFVLKLGFVHYTSKIDSSGTHDLGPLQKAIKRARERREPLEYRRGVNVAYVVKPNGADRYRIRCNLSPSDLYMPQGGGKYYLSLYVRVNKNEVLSEERFLKVSADKMSLSFAD